MEITFPVLVLEQDSGDILKFNSIAQMQSYLERIDVENDEYAAWDANGHPVRLLVHDPAWLKVVPAPDSGLPDVLDSLKRFAQARHVSLTDSEQRLAPVALYEAITAKGGSGRKLAASFRSRK
jgi:hypothetical protein